MKILKLDIEGFRSFKKATWTPGDLNIIIGPNGTGKSNLLRTLELISVAARGRLSKYIQTQGGMEPLVWDGRSSKIQFRIKTSPLPNLTSELTYDVELARIGGGSSYRVEHELLADYRKVELGHKSEPFKHLERFRLSGHIFDEEERRFTAPEEDVSEEETLLAVAAGPFTSISNRWIAPFQKQLGSWAIYQDIHVNSDAPIRQPVVARSEKRVAPDGQNLISVLHTLYTGDRDFKQSINEAMRAAFGDDFEELIFPPASDQRIQLRIRWKTLRREVSTVDISDGTLRFLFLLSVLASPSPPALIAIDEPETGLHPSMLPIVAEYAAEISKKTQVIMTTHSDQFLDAFGDIKPTITVTKWIDGETTLTRLSGKALDYWLQEYTLGALHRSGELENIA